MTKIAFVDTETTGLDATRHDMWELAMIVWEVNDHGRLERHLETIHTFLMPDMSEADPGALRMNKFYERTQMDPSFEWAPDEYAVAAHVAAILGTDNCHLAGMNVPFDAAFISKWLRLNSEQGAWHYHLIELESAMAAAAALQVGGIPVPWKSDDLSRTIGIDPPTKEERHTAIGDAEWCVRVYESIFGRNGYEDEAFIPDWAAE